MTNHHHYHHQQQQQQQQQQGPTDTSPSAASTNHGRVLLGGSAVPRVPVPVPVPLTGVVIPSSSPTSVSTPSLPTTPPNNASISSSSAGLWWTSQLMALIPSTGRKRTLVLAAIVAVTLCLTVFWMYYSRHPGLQRMVQFWSHVTPWVVRFKWLKFKTQYIRGHDPESQPYQDCMRQFHHEMAPRVVDLILKMGGIYVKMGQVLSTMAVGIVHDDYIQALRPLQDGIPPRSRHEMETIFQQSTGRSIDDVFEWMDDRPIGAASIAQAHKAILKKNTTSYYNKDDDVVIVKIQYPEVAELLEADLNNMELAARLVMPGSMEMMQAVQQRHARELDFRLEADHLRECAANLQQHVKSTPYYARHVTIPQVRNETGLCTQHVLVMEFLDGISLHDAIAKEQDRMARALGKENGAALREYFVQRIGEHLEQTHANATLQNDDDYDDHGDAAHDPVDFWLHTNTHRNNDPNGLRAKVNQWLQRVAMGPIGAGLFRAYVDLRNGMDGVIAGSLVQLKARPQFQPQTQTQQRQRQGQRPIHLGRILKTLIHVHGLQILKDGVYNADPHPGNVLVLPDGRLGLLDYGMVGRLTKPQRQAMAQTIVALAQHDKQAVTNIYKQAGYRATWKEGNVLDDINIGHRFATFHFDKFDLSPITLSSFIPAQDDAVNNNNEDTTVMAIKDKPSSGAQSNHHEQDQATNRDHHDHHARLHGPSSNKRRTIKTMDLLRTTQEWAVPDWVEQGRRLTGLLSGVSLQAGYPMSIAKEWRHIAEEVLQQQHESEQQQQQAESEQNIHEGKISYP